MSGIGEIALGNITGTIGGKKVSGLVTTDEAGGGKACVNGFFYY